VKIRLDRLRRGEVIYLVAAVLLFVLMFFKWYGVEAVQESNLLPFINLFDKGGSAWQTLEVIPIFLMLAIAVAVGAALLRIGGSDWKPVIPPGAAVCVLGALAALLILIKILSPPDLGFKGEGIVAETTLEPPVFLALAAALGIAYGGWRAMRDEGTSFAGVAKKLESPDRRPARRKSST
jgi:hypothetical protein